MENAQLITSDVQTVNYQQPPAQSNCEINIKPVLSKHPVASVTASLVKLEPDKFDSKVSLLPEVKTTPTTVVSSGAVVNPVDLKPYQIQLKPLIRSDDHQPQYCPTSSTEKFISSTQTVLAPKTADMESGFLMFTDDNKGMTVLTDADDLTHLAPDAGDLCVPMLPEMDFNDLSLLDELFVNGTSYNIDSTNIFSEDDFFNNLTNIDNEKLKLDTLDNLNLELDNANFTKKYTDANFMGLTSKGITDIKSLSYDQQYPLSNDPFLSFTNQSDDLFNTGSPTTRSDCSISDSYTSSTNSPSNSSSPNSLQFSPRSASCDEMTNKISLCDTTDFAEDKELEMRTPFIPIDDDYLLNDFSYSDSNMDDFFDWLSNGNSNALGMPNLVNDVSSQPPSFGNIKANNKSKPTNAKPNGACLEALLQNDKLVGSLKKKMYNSDQLLTQDTLPAQSQPAQTQQPSQSQQSPLVANSAASGPLFAIGPQPQSALKRKNSNILIYTTLSNTGEKKIKNVVLSADGLTNGKLSDKSTVHHFVLTKNNELIPKANFVANQSYKVSKRVLPVDSLNDNLMADVAINTANESFNSLKDELILKKARPDLEKVYCKYLSTSTLIQLIPFSNVWFLL